MSPARARTQISWYGDAPPNAEQTIEQLGQHFLRPANELEILTPNLKIQAVIFQKFNNHLIWVI